MDPFGRTIDYLRMSVTNRCDERCLYCRPAGAPVWETPELFGADLARVVRAAAWLGFRKFRLTGGEPLLRPDLLELVREMTRTPGVECVCLSTNGTRLEGLAQPLRQAGVRTVNLSLDALSPEAYRRITGGEVTPVLAGLRAAVAAGYESIKLNCVLLRGLNEAEIWPLVLFAAEYGLPLRLIELMPVGPARLLAPDLFLPTAEILERLRARDELVPAPTARLGFGPARYYRLKKTGALVGFISPMTHPHFCETCNRARLTADGKIRPCLGDHGEIDLGAGLRQGACLDALSALMEQALGAKPRRHQFGPDYFPGRPMTALGG